VALVGPTASGKSALALAVARSRTDVEIVAVDSMSVYRGMDIGTAKPSAAARAAVRHHLLDLVDSSEEFTVADFQAAARTALAGVAERGHRALLVGGTGLYVRAVVDRLELPGRWPEVAGRLEEEAAAPGGPERLHAQLAALDPLAASRTAPSNRRRVVRALEVTIGSGRPFSSFGPGLESYPPTPVTLVGLPFDPVSADRRIEERVARFMAEGLLDEVRRLAARPGGLSRTARQALGYRELLAHLEGGVPLEASVDEIVRRTRAYARRQWAWFRRDPRVRWVAEGEDAAAALGAALDAHPPAAAGAHGGPARGAKLTR
jgi:tRNA dimethylallyltransferase